MPTKIRTISAVYAADMPEEVIDYCLDHHIETHYQNDIVYIENDDNPFAKWLRENGFVFPPDSDGVEIGIFAT